MHPDYSLSVEAVYIQFARATIHKGGLRSLLWQAAMRQPRPKVQGRQSLPSWVPDLRVALNVEYEIPMGLDGWSCGWYSKEDEQHGWHKFGNSNIMHLFTKDGKLVVYASPAGYLVATPSAVPNAVPSDAQKAMERRGGQPLCFDPTFYPICKTPMQLRGMNGDLRAGDLLLAINERLIFRYIAVRQAAPHLDEHQVVGWCEVQPGDATQLVYSLKDDSLPSANVVLV